MKAPTLFGKYLLLDRINVGGMAEVFVARGHQDPTRRLVAVKRILPTMVEDKEFIAMFIEEARIAVQLNHVNIVPIYELGKHDEQFYIAMEYVSGRDLRTVLDRLQNRRIPVHLAVFIASKVCRGLDYAHRKRDASGQEMHIVHRDVSPQNVLLSYDGEVKIIDFGIAKAATRAEKTQAGILKGKFGYMSPEQVRGVPVDRRSDIFALGVLIYETLTGEKLFHGESDFSTLERVRNADVPSLRERNSAIPAGLEQVVRRALAKNPNERFAYANELHDALVPFLGEMSEAEHESALASFLKQNFADDLHKESLRLADFIKIDGPGEPGISDGPQRLNPTLPSVELLPNAEGDRTQVIEGGFEDLWAGGRTRELPQLSSETSAAAQIAEDAAATRPEPAPERKRRWKWDLYPGPRARIATLALFGLLIGIWLWERKRAVAGPVSPIGKVVIYPEPANGAEILIDGTHVQSDRNYLGDLSPGRHDLKVKWIDGSQVQEQFEIKPGSLFSRTLPKPARPEPVVSGTAVAQEQPPVPKSRKERTLPGRHSREHKQTTETAMPSPKKAARQPVAATPAPIPVEPAVTRQLPSAKGKLLATSNPVASIWVDGRDTGRFTPTSPLEPIELTPGDHQVEFRAPDGRVTTQRISVKSGEVLKLLKVQIH